MQSRRGLVTACLKIDSLVAHIHDLRIFLGTHTIDILAINETKFDSTITSNEIHISGSDIAKRDRPLSWGQGGGVCIFIKNNLNLKPCPH